MEKFRLQAQEKDREVVRLHKIENAAVGSRNRNDAGFSSASGSNKPRQYLLDENRKKEDKIVDLNRSLQLLEVEYSDLWDKHKELQYKAADMEKDLRSVLSTKERLLDLRAFANASGPAAVGRVIRDAR